MQNSQQGLFHFSRLLLLLSLKKDKGFHWNFKVVRTIVKCFTSKDGILVIFSKFSCIHHCPDNVIRIRESINILNLLYWTQFTLKLI